MALRASTAAEFTPAAGERGIVLSWLVSNGTKSERTGYFAGSLADADGVVVNGKAVTVYSAFYSLQPGAAARETMQFVLPAAYSPTKILLVDQGGPAGPAFRIDLKELGHSVADRTLASLRASRLHLRCQHCF